MKKHRELRKPTQREFDQFVEFELNKLDQTRREYGYCSYDEGDLAFMIDNASIVVFDHFNSYNPAPQSYMGKLMIVMWGLRIPAQYVWVDGKLTEVTEKNRAEIR